MLRLVVVAVGGAVSGCLCDVLLHDKLIYTWRLHMQAIVIEEFSMLSARFFETQNAVAQLMKHNEEPFGGMRLILVGDVAQLPTCGSFGF